MPWMCRGFNSPQKESDKIAGILAGITGTSIVYLPGFYFHFVSKSQIDRKLKYIALLPLVRKFI